MKFQSTRTRRVVPRRSSVGVIAVACLAVSAVGCDRGIEPFKPGEEPRAPSLERIYPKGAERAPSPAAGGGMGMGAGPSGRRDAPAPQGQGPAAIASGETISGVVEVAEALGGGGPKNATLFIIARKQPTGPPLAVLRVPNPTLPLAFEIGQAQVMIPSMKFEGEITLSARLDGDGNAMTKEAGDLVGDIGNSVVPGSSGLTLVLDSSL